MAEKISFCIARVCEWVTGVLMGAMTVVVLIGVFWRYVLGDALSWTEELSRYMMIWMCFLASSVLVREEGHIGITIFRDRAHPLLAKILLIFSDLAVMSFIAMWGYISLESYDLIKYDFSPGINMSLGWVFISQPICALLMLIQAALLLVKHLNFPAKSPDALEEGK